MISRPPIVHDDPEGEAPWALQLAIRAEKAAPPTHEAVCEATATAVVLLLASGEWAEEVRRWEDGRIRKLTRRARGARWEALQSLPGLTVEHQGAQVRAFPPGPVDAAPPEIAKLQVAGTDLEHGETRVPDRPYAVLVLNPDAAMSTGKAAAQSGHAAHLLFRGLRPVDREAWLAAGAPVHLLRAAPWSEAVARADVTVRDAGFTEVEPGTMTAAAWLVA
ncbi:MAG: peptidyl-tRNA hydrolase [Streptosporangiaceae bacterium]